MSLKDDIHEAIQGKTEPMYLFYRLRDLIRKACSKGGECDPLGPNELEGRYQYMHAARTLVSKGLFAASEALLLELWNDFGLRQLEEKSRVYRAGIAIMLTELYMLWGDKATAFKWALHTQADDILGEHEAGGGLGKQYLSTIFGMSESALEELDHIATECLKEVKQTGDNDWAKPAGFAEEVVRRFAQREVIGTHLLAEAASFREFPLSPAYFQALSECVHLAETPQEKGGALEDLAFYLLALLPGCGPRRNVLDEDLASESDIVVRNLNQVANLTAELLGRHFLVECKNWEKRVGVRDVGYFLYRMRLTHARFGIIFSKSGISGGDEGKAARALIRRAFHEDGSVCVVVDDRDLANLAQGKGSFWWMLLEKIEKLRFGRPRGDGGQSELRRIRGIGSKRADDLAQAGITTLAALASADTRGVADALHGVTVKKVETWQKEAGALVDATAEVT